MTKSGPKLVRSTERKRVPRPQPPMNDRRTKRNRDRGSLKREAIRTSREAYGF